MKKRLRAIFSPILNFFESGSEEYSYKPSHRKILVAMGGLFIGLSLAVLFFAQESEDIGYLFPVLIFGGGGLVSWIVAFLGSDRAVAKIWGSR